MIEGTGVDLVAVRRMEQALRRGGDRFLKKAFSQGEIGRAWRDSARYYAVLFAIKEAVLKSLGRGLFSLSLPEIEVFLEGGRARITGISGPFQVAYAADRVRAVALVVRLVHGVAETL